MSTTYPQRVSFEDHRTVRAIDLEDEQLFHLQRRWQHNLALHSWGILCGLEVRIENADRQRPKIVIRPGMALDGYGRELIVTGSTAPHDARQIFDPSVTYDLWLTYNATVQNISDRNTNCESGTCDRCESPDDTNLQRIDEQPKVQITKTSERLSGSITHPRGVPLEEIKSFSPAEPMKFDPASRWPVFLCKLEFSRGVWQVDDSERHYGGLIAQNIEAPYAMGQDSNTSQKETPRHTIVMTGAHPEHPDWRFAVLDAENNVEINAENKDQTISNRDLPDSVPTPILIRSVQLTPANTETPSESQKRSSMTEIRMEAERLVAESNLILENGAAILFETTPVEHDSVPPTNGWGIYRRFHQPENDPADANRSQFADALHLSMPKSASGTNSIAIGSVDNNGIFQEILVVHDDEYVDIHGVLRVHGDIYGNPTDLPTLDRDNQLKLLAERLPAAMKVASTEIRQNLITKVVEGASEVELLVGVSAEPTKKKKFFQEILKTAVETLGAQDTYDKMDKDFGSKCIYEIFIRNSTKELGVDKVYSQLDGVSVDAILLCQKFLNFCVIRLGPDGVYNSLSNQAGFEDLCQLFVKKSVDLLKEDVVFQSLSKTPDLQSLFVKYSAEQMDAAAFVGVIPISAHSGIVTASFNNRPALSRDGFTTAQESARVKVWDATWKTKELLGELLKAIPDDNAVIGNIASAMELNNRDIAIKIRNALTAVIGDGGS